jgi:hypothetical protein
MVERADGMSAVGEFLEGVKLAGALDVIGCVEQRNAACGDKPVRTLYAHFVGGRDNSRGLAKDNLD